MEKYTGPSNRKDSNDNERLSSNELGLSRGSPPPDEEELEEQQPTFA